MLINILAIEANPKSPEMKTIKIGIVSDTHDFDSFLRALPQIRKSFSACSYIIHAGDIINPQVLSELAKIAPLKAILGNKRADSINFPLLPRKMTIREGRVKIGVIHGLGNKPERIFNWFLGKIGLGKLGMKLYFKRIRRFFPNDVDCIIFGDLHIPVFHKEDNKLFFNPGTTDRKEGFNGSVGIIEVKKSGLFPKIIFL